MKLEKFKFPSQLTLIDLKGDFFYQERLLDLGFRPGVEVEYLGRVPFSGPFLLKVQGTIISLREEEASCLNLSMNK